MPNCDRGIIGESKMGSGDQYGISLTDSTESRWVTFDAARCVGEPTVANPARGAVARELLHEPAAEV